MKNRKKIFITLILALLVIPAGRVGADELKGYWQLRGTIGDSVAVMDIVKTGEIFSGSYYYTSGGRPLEVYGGRDIEGNLQLDEFADGLPRSGLLLGRISDSAGFHGSWVSSDGSRMAAVELYPTVDPGIISFMPYQLQEKRLLFDTGLETESPEGDIDLLYLHPRSGPDTQAIGILQDHLIKLFIDSEKRFTDPGAALDDYRNRFFENYFSIRDAYEPQFHPLSFSHDLDMKMRVVYNNNGMLSIVLDGYEFTGGAHGSPFTIFRVYNVATGEQIVLDDIMRPGSEMELQEILMEYLSSSSREIAAELIDQMEKGEEILINDNFYITHAGIGFYYNVYEIAPYAVGATEIFLPFAAIRHLLQENPVLFPLR